MTNSQTSQTASELDVERYQLIGELMVLEAPLYVFKYSNQDMKDEIEFLEKHHHMKQLETLIKTMFKAI